MCRFLLYLGRPIQLSSLLTEPQNSLIHQSFASREAAEPLNGDGFGVAWYTPELHSEAALFRSITPAWNNQNLEHLAKSIESTCVLAHVRAASVGLAVAESNTHPFVQGSYAFMHNGEIADFRHHRRVLMDALDDRRYESVEGSTDSECLFAHVLSELDSSGAVNAEVMAAALESGMGRVLALLAEQGAESPSTLNTVLSNGREAVACRYTSGTREEAPSLHLHTGKLYACHSGSAALVDAEGDDHAVIVASEPLTDDASWRTVPNNHLVLIDADRQIDVRPLDPAVVNAGPQ